MPESYDELMAERSRLLAREAELERHVKRLAAANKDGRLTVRDLKTRVVVLEKAARKLCNTPPGDWELTCNGEAFNELDALMLDQSGKVG